jgi:cell fate regulator YaaT (PSP1 superfamily)
MKMAKLQKTTLDPAKISGRCGRLKCCLRYEDETYRELESHLPPMGSRVTTPRGIGRVVAHEILVLRVIVEFEDRRRIAVDNDDVEILERPKGRRGSSKAGKSDSDSTPPEHGPSWSSDELS